MEAFDLSPQVATLVSLLANHINLTDRRTLEAQAARSVAQDIRIEIQRESRLIRPIADRILPGVNSIKDVETIVVPNGPIKLRDAVERDNSNTACILIPVILGSQEAYVEALDGPQTSAKPLAVGRGYIVASRCEIRIVRGDAACLVLGIGTPAYS